MSWIVFTVLSPLFGAVASVVTGGRLRDAVIALTAGGTALSCVMTAAAVHAAGAPLRLSVGGWGAPLGIRLHADGLAVVLMGATVVIGAFVTAYARSYFGFRAESGREALFWPIWFIMWGALNALYLSGDIFNLYVTLELINLSAVALVALPRTEAVLRAAIRYLFVAFLGSLSYLFGVALLYAETGALDIAMLARAVEPGLSASASFALMLAGLMIKCALFPMHFWLPPAHANAPSPVSALLSSVVVTASAYIALRLGFTVFSPLLASPLAPVIGTLGAAAVIWGSLSALLQPRMKMVVAYSTIAQVGYIFLLFPLAAASPAAATLAWYGAIYFAVCHACAKAAAFLAAGAVLDVAGHDEVRRFPGLARRFPVAFFAFGLAGVNLVGLPPSGGFLAKWLLLQSAIGQGAWVVAAVLIAGSLLAAGYIIRVLERAIVEEGIVTRPADRRHRGLTWPALGLAMAPIVLGFAAHLPMALLEIGSPVGAFP